MMRPMVTDDNYDFSFEVDSSDVTTINDYLLTDTEYAFIQFN